ncbi:hypothetical protein GGF32_007016, partial [Allomyces javanicus]
VLAGAPRQESGARRGRGRAPAARPWIGRGPRRTGHFARRDCRGVCGILGRAPRVQGRAQV